MSSAPPPLPGRENENQVEAGEVCFKHEGDFTGGLVDEFYQDDIGVYRYETKLVMEHEAELPDRCLKCNSPENIRIRTFRMSWHPPILIITIFAGILLYVILAIAMSQKGVVHAPLCARHYRKRRALGAWSGGLLLASVGALAVLFADFEKNAFWGWVSLTCFLGGMVMGIAANSFLRPTKIDTMHIWLKGVGRDYLNGLDRFGH